MPRHLEGSDVVVHLDVPQVDSMLLSRVPSHPPHPLPELLAIMPHRTLMMWLEERQVLRCDELVRLSKDQRMQLFEHSTSC